MESERVTRIAQAGDAAEVARLLDAFSREYHTDTPGEEVLTARCADLIATGEMIVVLAGAANTGLAMLRLRRTLWGESPQDLDAYLEELYVTPGRRGRGIGHALLERAMEVAREHGAVRIELGTSTDDVAAIGLYEATGFTNLEGENGPSMLFYEREL
jgi:GNAT superfamily N-acetyltransferase